MKISYEIFSIFSNGCKKNDNLKKNMPITLDTIVSQGGVSSTHLAKKFSFNNYTETYK